MVITLGDDIKSVMVEVGVAYTIEREGIIISGEYLDYDENTQMTKPFTFQNFLHVNLAYDTAAHAGDVIHMVNDGRRYLLTSILPELFENEIIQKTAVMYRTNCVGTIKRMSGEQDEYSYQQETDWLPVHLNFPALLFDKLYATSLDNTTQPAIPVDLQGLILYVPSWVTPLPHDRFIVSGESPFKGAISGELYYTVTSIETHTFDGVSIVYLSEDTRA